MDAEITEASQLTTEGRLEAILFQFITLYERWSEDRQAAAKQGAETAKLIEKFTEQVNHFQNFESSVRQQLIVRITDSIGSVGKVVGEEASCAARKEIRNTVERLRDVTTESESVLKAYKQEVITTQWKVILISVLTTITTCLVLVWSIIPAPKLPLNDQQLSYLEGGRVMAKIWPKFTKKEQERFSALARENK
jgi:hypothetical protein